MLPASCSPNNVDRATNQGLYIHSTLEGAGVTLSMRSTLFGIPARSPGKGRSLQTTHAKMNAGPRHTYGLNSVSVPAFDRLFVLRPFT